MQVNVHEAKSTLSRLIEAAERGEEVVIARAGEPAVRLVRVGSTRPGPRRAPGAWKGRVRIAADFDAPLPADVAEPFGASGA
jgi:prevent-host-death family protein